MKSNIERRYLGEVNYHPEQSKEENRYNQKHLKAYLKGYTRFIFGKDKEGNTKWNEVKQELKYI